MVNKTWTTIYISDEALKLLHDTNVKFHWLTPKTNSDKILALLNLYKSKDI